MPKIPPAVWYGAIYYPEHWPEERWPLDARMMREAGCTVTRLGEFAWCRMEPEEEHFDFGWLEKAVDTLARDGIAVLLGTPTAGPPAWLVNAPDAAQDCRMLYEDGTRWQFGGRSLCCVNHPRFRARSVRIARALGERFAAHPAVMGFQLDNELGMYGTRCYCDHCVAGFRAWLRAKYGDIDTLNRRLGTIFGSGEFRDFDDIPLPHVRQDLHNPGLLLDSQRFFSDTNVAYLHAQAAALRAAGARQPITHNVCHMFSGCAGIDNAALFFGLDVAGWDCYPQQFAPDPAPATLGLLHAIARAYKQQPFWMLEQQSGTPFGMAADNPRRIRLWTWQSIAHGASMILYFRWRTCRFGGEQYWRGIIDHPGTPNERYRVTAQVGAEIARLGAALKGLTHARRAAILLDFDNCESLTLAANYGAPRVAYRSHAEEWYEALRRRGIDAEVIYEPPAPGAYELVIAPALRILDAEWTARLRAFTAAGGTLVATIATASLSRDHIAPTEPTPCGLTDLFGVERVEWSALGTLAVPPKERQGEDAAAWAGLGSVEAIPVLADGPLAGQYTARTWCDHLRADSADVLARFAAGTPPGPAPAVTLNRFGAGCAVYVAALVEQTLLDRLITMLIAPLPDRPSSDNLLLEIVPAGDLCFLLNHASEPAMVHLPQRAMELLTGNAVADTLMLAPYDVAILR